MPSNYKPKSTKKPVTRKRAAGSSAPVPAPKSIGEKTAGYENEQRHPSGAMWNRIKANVISAHNGICYLCNHPNATQADHLVPYAEGGDDSLSNLRPAHGSAGRQKNRCPVCGLNCNQVRGNLSVEAGKRKIARRIEALGLIGGVNEDDEPFDW